MPDGLTSIDDLKVVITAETEKMSQGLANASELLGRFASDGESKLGRFDGAMAKAGAGVMALRSSLGLWAEGLNVALAVLERLDAKAETAFKVAGAGNEYATFKESVIGVTGALSDVMNGIDSSTKAASYLHREVKDLGNGFDEAGAKSEDFSTGALRRLTEAAERAAHEIRRIGVSDSSWSVGTVDAEIDRIKNQIASVSAMADKITANGTSSIFDKVLGTISPWHREGLATIDELREKLASLQTQLVAMEGLRDKKQWGVLEVDDSSPKLLQSLEREIDGLKLRAATLGMGAAEAAAYVAVDRIRQEAEKSGLPITEAMSDQMRERIGLMRSLRQQIEGHAEAERSARQAEQEGARQQRGEERLTDNLDRQLAALRDRKAGLGEVTAAMRAQQVEEQELNRLRQSGITITDAMRLQVKAFAASYGEADVALREHQKLLANMTQVTSVVFRGMETIISRSLDGTKTKMREVAASIVNDLAMVILKMMVLKPLQDSLTGGLTSAFSGGSSSLTSLIPAISGARAAGGPVSAGSTYLVGENGPELFTAGNSGNITANDNLRGAGRGSNPINVTISNNIDARGAYPESVEEIKRAVAEQNSRLPGRVLEVVGDARERGAL